MIVYLFMILFTSAIVYTIDFPSKYKNWNKLTMLVSTKHKSRLLIYSISIRMIIHALHVQIVQYLNQSARLIDKNNYEIEYIINGKIYKYITKVKKGPMPFYQIQDEVGDDITEFLLPYYGPNYDWHSTEFTPKFFKYNKIIFDMKDGSQKIFDEFDIIII